MLVRSVRSSSVIARACCLTDIKQSKITFTSHIFVWGTDHQGCFRTVQMAHRTKLFCACYAQRFLSRFHLYVTVGFTLSSSFSKLWKFGSSLPSSSSSFAVIIFLFDPDPAKRWRNKRCTRRLCTRMLTNHEPNSIIGIKWNDMLQLNHHYRNYSVEYSLRASLFQVS
jgi:hypothetical protein